MNLTRLLMPTFRTVSRQTDHQFYAHISVGTTQVLWFDTQAYLKLTGDKMKNLLPLSVQLKPGMQRGNVFICPQCSSLEHIFQGFVK